MVPYCPIGGKSCSRFHYAMGTSFCGVIKSTREDELHERISTMQEQGMTCPMTWPREMWQKYGDKKTWKKLKVIYLD